MNIPLQVSHFDHNPCVQTFQTLYMYMCIYNTCASQVHIVQLTTCTKEI